VSHPQTAALVEKLLSLPDPAAAGGGSGSGGGAEGAAGSGQDEGGVGISSSGGSQQRTDGASAAGAADAMQLHAGSRDRRALPLPLCGSGLVRCMHMCVHLQLLPPGEASRCCCCGACF